MFALKFKISKSVQLIEERVSLLTEYYNFIQKLNNGTKKGTALFTI